MSGSQTYATVQPQRSSFVLSKADDSKILWLAGKLNVKLFHLTVYPASAYVSSVRVPSGRSIPYSTVALNILNRYVNITARNTKRMKDAAAPYPSRKNW